MRRLTSLLRTLFRSRRLDRDLDDELRAYLDDRIAQRIVAGVPPAEARRQVLADEGGVEAVKEHTRSARLGFGLATVVQDLQYGCRTMRRTPGFTLVACATLAVGIGATLAMLTVMQSVLWRPLPYPDPDRLVVIDVDARGVEHAGASAGEILDLRARSRTLERIAAINPVAAHVDAGDEVIGAAAANVSDDLLPALGVLPAHGRTLAARLDAGDPAARGVVITDALWRRGFAADPAVVGRWVPINNQPRQIVGVLPPGFRVLLPSWIGAPEQTDVWFSNRLEDEREFPGLGVVARLAGAATLADAQRELDAIAAAWSANHPTVYGGAPVRLRVRRAHDAVTAPIRPGLRALGLAVGFVLLLGCVNVATLLLARGTSRAHELAVRRALGAARARLIRQVLTESLLLAGLGSALGVLAASAAVGTLDWLRPAHLPRQAEIAMDGTVAAAAVAIALISAAIVGGLPAMRLTAGAAHAPAAGRGQTTGRQARRVQRTLVAAEIALSIVPLVAAGLMLRTFVNLTETRLGFEPDGLLTAQMPISFRQFESTESRLALHRQAFERLRALPGVEAVSAASPVPFEPLQITRRYGRAGEGTPAAVATIQSVFPGYLQVAGTRLREGREFTADDVAAGRRAVVIDARIAAALWPAGAIGQRLALASGARLTELEVVGVTEPVRTTAVRDDGRPHVFIPYHVFPLETAIVLRTRVPAETIAPLIRREIAALGTGRAVDVRPLAAFVADAMAETRFTMLVLAGFAAAALLLAAIGLYGTLAYLTSARTREFGVRLALGATRRQMVALVAREGMTLTIAGAAAGLAAALVVAHAMRGLFYGVEPIDPITLLVVAALLGALAIAACLRPAWTAARTDPALALKD